MNSEKKFVKKSFWVHQYEKEEEFLSDMRTQGWKFKDLHKGIPTKYEFEKCEPEEYNYQLDYVRGDEDTEFYHQLFKDTGWDEIFSWDGVYNGKWYYFCKKIKDGKREKLYTDSQSKIYLVNKLLMTYGLFFLLIMCMGINSISLTVNILRNPTPLLWLNILMVIFVAFGLVWLGYCGIGMLLLKRRLKAEMENKL